MISYMDYVQRCFYGSTDWNEDNLYENILATSNNLLNFQIPKGFKLNVSSKTAEHSYSSFQLAQLDRLSSSAAYFYSSIDMKNVSNSTCMPLQTMIDGYKLIQSKHTREQSEARQRRPTLLYSKMYFPSQFLEAMLIQRLSESSQLTVKCVSTPKTKTKPLGNGMLTFFLQRDTGKSSQEYIYSSIENLLGFRCLYNIGENGFLSSKKLHQDVGISSSILSIGTELWYAAATMSPGVSTSMRYSTHLASSGKPLVMTVSVNPLLGAVSSTYSIKTGLGTTFTSRYDFNVYSYDSDLSLGYNFWRLDDSNPKRMLDPNNLDYSNIDLVRFKKESLPLIRGFVKDPNSFNSLEEDDQLKALDSFMHVKPGRWLGETAARKYINDFELARFTSSFMVNTSLKKKNVNLLWEGKYKDFLLSGGVNINYHDAIPKVMGYGLEVQFAS